MTKTPAYFARYRVGDGMPLPTWRVVATDPHGGPDWIEDAYTLADAKAKKITLEAYGFGPIIITRKEA